MPFFSFNRSNASQAGTLQVIDAHTLKQWVDQQTALVIDVREPSEYAAGHLPGATLVPLSTFDPDKIPQTGHQTVVLYCRSGQRSTLAAQHLLNAGFPEITHLEGGIGAWVKAGYPLYA